MSKSGAAIPHLGFPAIDADHQAFYALLEKVGEAGDDFPVLFAELLAATEKHFSYENSLMDRYGLGARDEHQAEHRRLLNEFTQINRRVARGLHPLGRAYVRERLPQWFVQHLGGLDSALVADLKQRQIQE
ncbi:bacteriohemerythrin [Marinospirillum perlucidum]|uniref:bacteriohemerythrin n=1 Tax=Marinospirillum perlucidum TaxID=1982602 RepID=UPI000DF2640C|nr:hemerythrin family protein [Marinospirillum perlucidum]